MIAFDPSDLDAYLAADIDGPVVMLNLLRFHPEGGAEKYLAYAEHFETAGINARYGVELLYAGRGGFPLVAERGQDWDMVALVRYPSRRHFVDMVNDPAYREFEHLRTEALVESVLQPTSPMGSP
jgi:uncharacterized protein (DUF1330 family)